MKARASIQILENSLSDTVAGQCYSWLQNTGRFVNKSIDRICPGQLLADDEFYITVAAVLSVFNILPESDKEHVRLPDWSRSEGYLSSTISCVLYVNQHSAFLTSHDRHPDPFNCRIVPRSRETELLIRASDPSRL